MYNWEASGKKQGKRAKKTGTVILHTDEQVDLTFERLCKEQYVQDAAKEASNTTTPEPQSVGDDTKLKVGKKAPLMTEATASSLERRMGFKELLPSQAQCYRGIFKGRDVILHSRTGSGKTLAYALPIIERHLILETSQARNGPFVIIFVFSDELAYQTRGVLQKIYKKLVIGVAGLDNISSQPHDIIIGTVGAVDIAVRGPRADAGRGRAVSKRLRSDDDDEDGLASEGDSDDDDEEIAMRTLVDVSGVRAIVVDEVDTTLGPRYSNTGRRMRNLLKVIRRANGALSESLLSDFRSHHYVLCGATIPNWVIKAGFLGEKKFYYQLISVGAEKLPPQLEVFATGCARNARVERASAILNEHNLGRVVVFGTPKEMSRLEDALTTHRKNVVRSLLPKHDEADRIKAMDDFNSKSTANVLLCTDLAARGLDFTDVDTVLMLSLPSHNMAAEVFVHRAGRTARVGKPGRCVLLFDDRMDTPMLDAITKFTHVTFRKMALLEATASDPHAKGTTPMTSFQLKVKNAFNGKEPSANPESILRHALGESSFEQVVGLTHPSGDTQIVRFEFPMELSHVVTAKLWKYDIREVKRQVV